MRFCTFFPTPLFSIIILICIFPRFDSVAQDFANGNFESSSTCDPASCSDDDMSCIDGWWSFDNNSNTFGWFKYPYCWLSPNDISACPSLESRGVWLQTGSATAGPGIPNQKQRVATNNPLYNSPTHAIYKLTFDLIAYPELSVPNATAAVFVKIYGSTHPTSGASFIASTEVPVEFGFPLEECPTRFIILDTDNSTCAEFPAPDIRDFPYIVFAVSALRSSDLAARGVLDNVKLCKIFEVNVSQDCETLCIEMDHDSKCYNPVCEEVIV